MDVTADQVLEEVIAVEPAPSLPQLGDPRPNLVGLGADGDGARGDEVGGRDQLIAGKRPVRLLAGGAPRELPASPEQNVSGCRASDGGGHSNGNKPTDFECFAHLKLPFL